jgi:Kelch motif
MASSLHFPTHQLNPHRRLASAQALACASVLASLAVACSGDRAEPFGETTSPTTLPLKHAAVSDFTVRMPMVSNSLGPPGQLEFVTKPVVRGSTVVVQDDGTQMQSTVAPAVHATATIPRNCEYPIELRDVSSGVEITFGKIGLSATEPALGSSGLITWSKAYGGVGDVAASVSEDGVEDYVVVDAPALGSEIVYDVGLTKGVAGVREIGETLEFLDSNGVPRLRVAAPNVVDSKQLVVPAKLVVLDCEVDTDPVPSEGRPFQHVTSDRCRVAVSWDPRNLVYPVLVDPSWSSTATMVSPRYAHICMDPRGTAFTPMVCAGGINNLGAYLASAERYSSSSNTWSVTGSMATPRAWFAEVGGLVVGGLSTGNVPTATTAQYSMSSGTWTTKASMSVPRVLPAASDLQNGNYLVSGGWNASSYLATTERYNVAANSWSPGPTMYFPRAYHTSTRDLSNNVVIVGGHNGAFVSTLTEYYVTSTNTLAIGNGPAIPVYSHTATLIGAGPKLGKIYIGGGETGTGPTDALQRWEWTYWAVDGHVGVTREWHVALLMGGSQNMIFAGGWWPYGSLASAFVRDPAGGPGGTWSNMAKERMYFAGGVVKFDSLGASKPVFAGGWNTQLPGVLQSAEVYTP